MVEFKKILKQSNFLVTGGAGFIGSNLVEYLIINGAKSVRVLDNLSTGLFKNIQEFENLPNFEFMKGDICNLDDCMTACAGMDYVSHQAALGSVPRSINDPITTNNVNISGFLNMLIASRDQKVKRFVYAASSSTYGDSKSLPKVEDVIGKPLSPYAVTKYVNELYADVFANLYGMQSIGLRYFNVFGPKQNPSGAYAAVIPSFIGSILNEDAPYINGDGEQTRDFTYVENVIQANVRALLSDNSDAINQVYNIAIGDRTSLNQLFHVLAEIESKQIEPIYRDSRAGDVRDSLADISKSERLLGYKPNIGLVDGLRKTYFWFKSQMYNDQS